MVKAANAGHIGGSMSCMDILVVLYYRLMDTKKIMNGAPDRDRFILSKGHCAEALYAVFADIGFIEPALLKTFAAFDTALAKHPTRKITGVEAATGALGHGLPIGAGMGIALKADRNPAAVYVLLGDGEMAEGSVWEAAMAAAKYKLNNLTAIVDRNRLQISGNTEDVMPLDDLADKFRAFGWECRTCDGHEPEELIKTLKDKPLSKPLAVIAETVKGFGSAVMENKAEWHHLVPNDIEFERIKNELTKRRNECG
ncbi:MAG: transketolase [Oscillospiraceae bacterium]|nr:transketolase [Oscillospiraceae bacterium]